jgi:hypothetical protein
MEDQDEQQRQQGPSSRDDLQDLFNVMMMGFLEKSTAAFAAQQQQQQPFFTPTNNNNLIGNDIKLKLPDKYDGTRDVTTIENFFCAVDKLQYIKGWDERKTFLIASTLLSGRAETWVNHLEKLNDGSAPTTWTHLKEILTSKFKPTNGEDVARDLLWVTTQKTTIQAYVDAFMDCSILITDTTDADLCDRFVRGLKNE